MKKSHLILIAALLGGNTVTAADSVHEWGSWQAEDDIVAAILAGADPAEVTSAPAAGPGAKGTVVQPIIPVALDNRFITQGDMPKEFEVVQVIQQPIIELIDNLDKTPEPGGGLVEVPAGDQNGRPVRNQQ